MTEESPPGECPYEVDRGTFTRRRRFLLECLQRFDEPVSLPDLADEIAVKEAGRALSAISGERVKDIYLALYHRHIPDLVAAGHVEYDQDADLVFIADGWNPDVPTQPP